MEWDEKALERYKDKDGLFGSMLPSLVRKHLALLQRVKQLELSYVPQTMALEMRERLIKTLFPGQEDTPVGTPNTLWDLHMLLISSFENLRDDRRRALKAADDLTLETQTCEEAVTELVNLVREVRVHRDEAYDRNDSLRRAHEEDLGRRDRDHELLARVIVDVASCDMSSGLRKEICEVLGKTEQQLVREHYDKKRT